jgi:hypothetical protein
MNRIRIGCALTMIAGLLYAAFGVFDSLTKFGLGLVVASAAVIAWGLVDYLDARQVTQWQAGRDDVWARRHLRVVDDQ